jgi:2-polyprenyl-6-methoxyphenol hydroxylase-like FAD-dependent oxidoreductase
MLLARHGLRVLVVDPVRYGSDTLSTHALMRGAVLQLDRWGLLDSVRASGAPAIRTTTFHYGAETVEVEIRPRDGIDCLYAPRRTILDPLLVDAAREAGAEIIHGLSVVDLLRDGQGRVTGVRASGADREVIDIPADMVIGADGIRSRVARILAAGFDHVAPHAAASIYGYFRDIPLSGYHWFYEPGVSTGTIPTNDGQTCVFALMPGGQFSARQNEGIEALFHEVVASVSPDLHASVRASADTARLRAFPGTPGFLRRSVGPGWVLVGDAGYFRDPITAHGITDALREAEIVARAIVSDGQAGLDAYQEGRDARVMGLLTVTDRIASCDWELEEVKEMHLELNRQMKAEVEVLLELHGAGKGPRPAASAGSSGLLL